MAGFGSVGSPFNEAFGRIIEVHWSEKTWHPPISATATYFVDPTPNTFSHPPLLHDLTRTSFVGDPLVSLTDFDTLLSLNNDWSISISNEFHSGILGSGGSLDINLVVISSGAVIDTPYSSAADGSYETSGSGPIQFAVSGVMTNGAGYDFLSATVTATIDVPGYFG